MKETATKVLAALRFDKWPLVLSVLKGDLSFIGPIPEKPDRVRGYSASERGVLSVRPGLVGPWDLLKAANGSHSPAGGNDDRKDTDLLPQRLKAELQYVKDQQLGKDIRLLIELFKLCLYRFLKSQISLGAQGRNFLLPVDVILVTLSYFLAYQLRFDWAVPRSEFVLFLKTLPFVLTLRIASFYISQVYRNLWKYIGVKDLVTIITACTMSSTLVVTAIFLLGFTAHSRSIFLIDWMLCVLLVGGFRLTLRLFNEKLTVNHAFRKNIVIMGAGDVGEMLLRHLQKSHEYHHNIVGFLDDDHSKHGLSIHGVRVLGECRSIIELTPILRIDEVLITMAELSPEQIKQIIKYCKQAEVRHRIVPAVSDLLSGRMHLSRFRSVEISDLFGRQPVELDLSAIASFLQGRRVLVTGAGGSIGSELCRQIAEYKPGCLILVDKNENYLHEVRCELDSQFDSLLTHCHLSDITHKRKQAQIFQHYRPEIVFHAAAHKHVPLSEENPAEAIANNVFGTKVIADLAGKYGVRYFVMVSTDKAVNPTNVMGATKRAAELYIQSLSRQSKTNYVTVRFGNVLNSNGSVIPIFMKQIEKGGPVTVTHPDVERYFMSISEAVHLILQAVTMGKSGEIFVLEMGKSIKIVDMAKELIKQAGFKPFEDIPIRFTGLRPGEKMFEELVGHFEQPVQTSHASIKTLKSKRVLEFDEITAALNKLEGLLQTEETSRLRRELQNIVPEYSPAPAHDSENRKDSTTDVTPSFYSRDMELALQN